MLYVVFTATFAVAFVISSRVLGTHTRATVRESVSDVRLVHPWLAAGVWSLVAAVFVTAPVDALTSLAAGAMA